MENGITYTIYKSNRKNAQCLEFSYLLPLITKNDYVNNDRIIDQLADRLDKIVYYVSIYETPVNICCHYHIEREDSLGYMISTGRKSLTTTKNLVYMLFTWSNILYPYNTIELLDIYENSRIKKLLAAYSDIVNKGGIK